MNQDQSKWRQYASIYSDLDAGWLNKLRRYCIQSRRRNLALFKHIKKEIENARKTDQDV
jgi:hypothetical protein